MSMLSLVAAEHLAGGNTDRGKMDVSGMAPGYRVYQTREGFIALGTLEDAAYEKFLNYIDRKHIKSMPEESQIAELSRYFLDCDSSSIQRLIDAELLVSRVNSVAEAMTSARLDIDYDKVIEYATLDKRLGTSHWKVPGPDGHRGFGGSCFPKDINALMRIARENGVDPMTLDGAWRKNLDVRPERDWEQLKGRAVA
jgi:UDP-glucose 6-dehydrogenase